MLDYDMLDIGMLDITASPLIVPKDPLLGPTLGLVLSPSSSEPHVIKTFTVVIYK